MTVILGEIFAKKVWGQGGFNPFLHDLVLLSMGFGIKLLFYQGIRSSFMSDL